jgi:hypothetical protein
MIDRRTALACAALAALMLVAAGWRVMMLEDWTTLPIANEAPLPSLSLLFLPACGALVTGALYWEGFAARTDDAARLQPWYEWGRFFTIGYCTALLLLQGVVIVASLGLGMPFNVLAVIGSGGVLIAIMTLPALNQLPKLPWFERRFAPGGELGPVYGPRYVRIESRILVVFVIAVIALNLAVLPTMGWGSAAITPLAVVLLLVQSIMWRRHLGRKWKLEQRATGGAKP